MRTVLSESARLLTHLVDEDGEIRELTLAEIVEPLQLTPEFATALAQRVAAAGFVELSNARVRPTVAGVSLGVMLAASRSEVRRRELRIGAGPYWTYVPEEVSLNGKWS